MAASLVSCSQATATERSLWRDKSCCRQGNFGVTLLGSCAPCVPPAALLSSSFHLIIHQADGNIEICRIPRRILVVLAESLQEAPITLRLQADPSNSGRKRNLKAVLWALRSQWPAKHTLSQHKELSTFQHLQSPWSWAAKGRASSGNPSEVEVSDNPQGLTSRTGNCDFVFGLLLCWSELYSNNSNNKSWCSSRTAGRETKPLFHWATALCSSGWGAVWAYLNDIFIWGSAFHRLHKVSHSPIIFHRNHPDRDSHCLPSENSCVQDLCFLREKKTKGHLRSIFCN